jgi:hypothetical protein
MTEDRLVKQISVVVCLASALLGCASQTDAPAPAAQLEDAAADQVQGPALSQPTNTPPSTALVEQEMHCDVEAKCLAKLRGIASRSGKNLSLKLDNGSTKSFLNTERCEIAGESCVQTSLIDYRPSQHLFVLSAHYYESFGSIMVSQRTGEVFRIEDAAPHFSPDGKRFVVVAVNEQDGINQVAIYSTSAFPPAPEWSYTPKSFATTFGFVGWNGNDQIKLRTLDQNSEASMSRISSGWKLAPPDG